jgi:hypothetical protein
MSEETKEQEVIEPLNIYQRLSKVRESARYIKKESSVQGKYKAITHDEVTSLVREPFIEIGILIIPTLKSSHIDSAGETSSGTPIIRYSGWYQIDFVNIDIPEDRVSIEIESHANDHGDKAPGKALSYAVKYAMLKVLNIETGESDESRVEIAKKQQKPALNPDHEKWSQAVNAIKSKQTSIESIKKHYGLSMEDELTMIQEATDEGA